MTAEPRPTSSREPTAAPTAPAPRDDDAVRTVVARLARPHASGGTVVERAALLAEGADYTVLAAWITAHGGVPEEPAPGSAADAPGLHGGRTSGSRPARPQTARRFVLPAGALS
jgi:hypothetical protein